MQPKTFTKSEIHQAIDELSTESLAEIALFLEFLKFKDRIAGKIPPQKHVVQLGGLWQDIPFDITDEEVRTLRQAATRHLLDKEL